MTLHKLTQMVVVFTQLGGGRGEMVSVFTYYCDKSFYAESGGFIRGLNCSSAYGEQGAVADGTLAQKVL
jgi:hypothetical protein